VIVEEPLGQELKAAHTAPFYCNTLSRGFSTVSVAKQFETLIEVCAVAVVGVNALTRDETDRPQSETRVQHDRIHCRNAR